MEEWLKWVEKYKSVGGIIGGIVGLLTAGWTFWKIRTEIFVATSQEKRNDRIQTLQEWKDLFEEVKSRSIQIKEEQDRLKTENRELRARLLQKSQECEELKRIITGP